MKKKDITKEKIWIDDDNNTDAVSILYTVLLHSFILKNIPIVTTEGC